MKPRSLTLRPVAIAISCAAALIVGSVQAQTPTSASPASAASAPVSPSKPAPSVAIPAAPPTTFVIVHGAWGGGWAFKKVDALLTAAGHTVYRPTLTGQGEKVHLARADIDLTTHITDVVHTLVWEDLHDVVLVGHSYGGMVITGVIDRVPDRIRRVVYLDALAPEDGESLEQAWGDAPTRIKPGEDFLVPSWVQPGTRPPHDVPHPVRTWTQPVVRKNPDGLALPSTYILTVDAGAATESDRFFKFYTRAQARGWSTEIMIADHNPQWSQPETLAARLAHAAATPTPRSTNSEATTTTTGAR